MSWESSAEYYRIINQEVRSRLGPLRSAQILMHSVDFGPVERAQHEGRWDDAGAIVVDAALKLAAGGADCIVLCTNTMHLFAERIQAAVPLPFLHIADPVGKAANAHQARTIGLLGTAFTMERDFFKSRLAGEHGLTVLIPDETERKLVHRIIYEELCMGEVRETSRASYQAIMARMAARGAGAIILGCTEISLLVSDRDCSVPLLDTTRLHAHAAVDFALG